MLIGFVETACLAKAIADIGQSTNILQKQLSFNIGFYLQLSLLIRLLLIALIKFKFG